MNKYIYGIVLATCLSACTGGKTNGNEANTEKDSILTIETKDSLISNMDSTNIDTLQHCILDTLPNGEIFYIKESINTEKKQYNDTTTLYLYKYNNGESKLIDSITIEGFCSSSLSNYPDCEWLDTCFILNDTTQAYGHSVYASNPSYEDHLMSNTIDLIAITPHSISHIYSDDLSFTACNDYMSGHEDCEGTINSFKTADTKTNGHYDIIVTEQKWHEVMKENKRKEYSNNISTYKLKYKNGKYEK